jgi:hypothetical protein
MLEDGRLLVSRVCEDILVDEGVEGEGGVAGKEKVALAGCEGFKEILATGKVGGGCDG